MSTEKMRSNVIAANDDFIFPESTNRTKLVVISVVSNIIEY